jgi:hypothetical protein
LHPSTRILLSWTTATSLLDKRLNKKDTNIVSKCTLASFWTARYWLDHTHYVCIENLCLFQKITLHICTPVACVLLFRIKNIILSTSSRYHSSSKRQQICHCSRNSLSILTNVLFIGEFLTKSNAKLSFSDSTYSKMSRRKFWLTTL